MNRRPALVLDLVTALCVAAVVTLPAVLLLMAVYR